MTAGKKLNSVWAQALVGVAMLCAAAVTFSAEPRELTWEDLVPQDELFALDQSQSEPALSIHSFTAKQQSGTVVPELNGKRVKIPAFVVPLDGDDDSLTELLLVPYFGACIHVPPPPSNQIIYFESEKKSVDVKKLDLYRPVWATGTLMTEETDHELAQVSYRMDIEFLEEYKIKY